jgi:hypothetical protein
MCGEWSTYGVPGGKSDAGSTEWKIDVTLPVTVEMTIVASVRRPETMALDEASTVMRGMSRLRDGVCNGEPVACGAIMCALLCSLSSGYTTSSHFAG